MTDDGAWPSGKAADFDSATSGSNPDAPANEIEYECQKRRGVFLKVSDDTWSDEAAEAEWQTNFPGHPEDDKAIVCDDCYRAIMKRFRPASCQF